MNWILALREGDNWAATKLWDEYFSRLAAVASRHLPPWAAKASDEEDVALSALKTFCRRVQRGEFDTLAGRDELWKLLALITKRKAITLVRHEATQRRGGGKVQGESVLANAVAPDMTPDLANEMLDELRHLFQLLHGVDEILVLILQRKIEGFNNKEIAAELSRHPRTVERKIEMIQTLWAEDLQKRADQSDTA